MLWRIKIYCTFPKLFFFSFILFYGERNEHVHLCITIPVCVCSLYFYIFGSRHRHYAVNFSGALNVQPGRVTRIHDSPETENKIVSKLSRTFFLC